MFSKITNENEILTNHIHGKRYFVHVLRIKGHQNLLGCSCFPHPPPPPGHRREPGVPGVYLEPCPAIPPGPQAWVSIVGLVPRLLTAVSFRTLNGLGILVCSMDGSVAFLDFSQDELGDPLSEEEKVGQQHQWPVCCTCSGAMEMAMIALRGPFNWTLFL